MTSFRAEEGGHDGSLTFDEAYGPISGMKLQGPASYIHSAINAWILV